jgi:hypothetical protein
MNGSLRPIGGLAFWPAAALGAALTGWLVLAAVGVVPVRPAERTEVPAAVPARVATVASVPERVQETPATTRPQAPPASARSVTVTVTASRGASWIAARLGSSSGRLLEERLLPQGETARLTGARVWLLVGASGNVDVHVDGKPRTLAPGTVETVFAPAPVR